MCENPRSYHPVMTAPNRGVIKWMNGLFNPGFNHILDAPVQV